MAGKRNLSWVTPVLLFFHLTAWGIAMLTIWRSHDPAQPASGPTFNNARLFLSRVDALIYPQVEGLAGFIVGQFAGRIDPGSVQWTMFTIGVLVAGSVQWYFIGRAVGWVNARYGLRVAFGALTLVGLWLAMTSVLWFVG